MHRIDTDNITYLIADISRLLRIEFERLVAEDGVGVTPAEARILVLLARCGPVRQQALASRLNITKMSMTGFLEKLEKAGLVERIADPADARAKLVSLTGNAEPLLRRITATIDRLRQSAQAEIATDDWQRFKEVALQLRRNLVELRQKQEGRN